MHRLIELAAERAANRYTDELRWIVRCDSCDENPLSVTAWGAFRLWAIGQCGRFTAPDSGARRFDRAPDVDDEDSLNRLGRAAWAAFQAAYND